VILNWNGIDDTLECLASIAKLSYSNVKTIVVDNGSEGDQANAIAKAFPSIMVLAQPENLGFCGGCNVGIKEALANNADFVMLLNNDALVSPNLLEGLIAGYSAKRNVSAVSPVIIEYPGRDRLSVTDVRWNPLTARFDLAQPSDVYESFQTREPYRTEFACGCCLFASADVFREYGLLDERYFAFFDEAEWCSRLRRHGLESYIVPSTFVYHKGGRSTPSLVSAYLMTRNRLLWMRENLPWAIQRLSLKLLFKDLVWHSANLLGITRGHYTKQHSRAALRGYRDYFLGRFGKWPKSAEKILFPDHK